MSYARKKRPVALSIGILACNEETSIQPMLASLFRQTVFERLLRVRSTIRGVAQSPETVLSETQWGGK